MSHRRRRRQRTSRLRHPMVPQAASGDAQNSALVFPVASWQVGTEGRGQWLSPKFWAVGKLSFCREFFVQKCKIWGRNPHFRKIVLKFWAPIISSVGNLQLSVGKLQRPGPPTVFDPRRRWVSRLENVIGGEWDWWIIALESAIVNVCTHSLAFP